MYPPFENSTTRIAINNVHWWQFPLILFQVRDLQKKMQQVENELDNTLEKLGGTNVKLDEKVELVS